MLWGRAGAQSASSGKGSEHRRAQERSRAYFAATSLRTTQEKVRTANDIQPGRRVLGGELVRGGAGGGAGARY